MTKTKFVTISNQRSGSSVFQRMLDSHPRVSARQEDMSTAKARRKVGEILRVVYAQSERNDAIGWKLQYEQATLPVWRYIRDNGVKIIQLIRRDMLETALWWKDKHAVGDFEGGLGVPVVVRGKVRALVPEVCSYMELLRERIDIYREYADFTVYYLDVCGNEDAREFYDKGVRKRLLGFLGVDDRVLVAPEKQVKSERSRDLSSLVENWDELVGAMKERKIGRYYEPTN